MIELLGVSLTRSPLPGMEFTPGAFGPQPRVYATSDLHGDLSVDIPPCDVLIVAGDVCPVVDHALARQLTWLDGPFREWLLQVPAARIIGIAGNHDFVFEKWPLEVLTLDLPWTYLQDTGTSFEGLRFWGTPWVPNLSRWAFHAMDHILDEKLALVPSDTDIVISHGPPHRYRDLTVPRFGGVNAGFPGANDMLNRVKPHAFVCGHIHEAYGVAHHRNGVTDIFNVSRMTENYEPINPARMVYP